MRFWVKIFQGGVHEKVSKSDFFGVFESKMREKGQKPGFEGLFEEMQEKGQKVGFWVKLERGGGMT